MRIVIEKIEKYREEAAKALAEVGLTPENVSDFAASVGPYGVGVAGCLPDAITSAWSDEPFSSKTLEPDDARDSAWIAAEVLALCRFVERKRADGQSMFLIATRLAEAVAALHDPEKKEEYKREYKREWAQSAGRGRAWYTDALVGMCKRIRKRHPAPKADDIFYDLPGAAKVPPIGAIDLDGDELTIIHAYDPKKLSVIKRSSFRTFCTHHKILK